MPSSRARSSSEDAFGHALLAAYQGARVPEFIERKDGHLDLASRDVSSYFAPFEQWSKDQQEAAGLTRGRVLDIGCGAGRFLVHLEAAGHEVVGIDLSPLALEVCRRRGARDVREMSVFEMDESLGEFDSVLLMGNNFGILGSPKRASRAASTRVASPT